MNRVKVAPEYDIKWAHLERPSPLTDSRIEKLQQELLPPTIDQDITDQIYLNFKKEMTDWLFQSKLNCITGFDSFNRVDIINGCTQFIDNIYMQGQLQVLIGDYRYHNRLGNQGTRPGLLREGAPLVIAMPFPSTGDVHSEMKEILDECLQKEISVHIDGAWITCCRDINFDVSHPAICSVGISLSKGLGLGWNRIGLRWTRDNNVDAITIMNDFHMNNRALAIVGLHYIRNLPPDYLWNTHGEHYYKICRDFNLTPTKSIYLALKDGDPIGISPLIRYLDEQPK
jgi:hypothetical protein